VDHDDNVHHDRKQEHRHRDDDQHGVHLGPLLSWSLEDTIAAVETKAAVDVDDMVCVEK